MDRAWENDVETERGVCRQREGTGKARRLLGKTCEYRSLR
jgi:hypothetical protein